MISNALGMDMGRRLRAAQFYCNVSQTQRKKGWNSERDASERGFNRGAMQLNRRKKAEFAGIFLAAAACVEAERQPLSQVDSGLLPKLWLYRL